jgi:hypothetical protein
LIAEQWAEPLNAHRSRPLVSPTAPLGRCPPSVRDSLPAPLRVACRKES